MQYPIEINEVRDELLSEFGKQRLRDSYLLPNESPQQMFARVASAYADDRGHAQRLYEYISRLWFMPATPVLSNGGTARGLPISCFLNEVQDNLTSIAGKWNECVWLSAKGGGIGTYWGNVRSIGEKVGQVGSTSGIIPFIQVQNSISLAISQGNMRRGSAAVYLPVDHPEIEEFLEMRRTTGGDPNRKALFLHNGVVIPDIFMECVKQDLKWQLRSPKDGSVVRKVSARELWAKILTTRMETGEPYLLFIDTVNKAMPKHLTDKGLRVKTSNLCSEITLPTGLDQFGHDRTAVCCLSSVNIAKYDEWSQDKDFVEDVLRFLDNVLQDFIDRAPPEMSSAVYSAVRERSIGLGAMGFHTFLQAKGIPIESPIALSWNNRIFKELNEKAQIVNRKLAQERGPCLDSDNYPDAVRFSHVFAIAPNASTSIICGNVSPGIEPNVANVFVQKTQSGSFVVKNNELRKVLMDLGMDTDDVWHSITVNNGSVQHLDLPQEVKDVFKTAFELDQRWLIDLAAMRQKYICQAQSLNLFFPADVEKKYLNEVHFRAWSKGCKSLYYVRSRALNQAEKLSINIKSGECIACEG